MKFLKIEFAQEKQLAAIGEIDQLCFGGLWSQEAYQRELTSPKSSLWILSWSEDTRIRSVPTTIEAESHTTTKIIGIGCLWAILEEAHITLLGIHPDYRKQGLGQLLLYTLLKDAIRRKLEWATLEVRENNYPALALYQKFGFKIAGTRKKYYQATGENALILWRGGLSRSELTTDLDNWQKIINERLKSSQILWEQQI